MSPQICNEEEGGEEQRKREGGEREKGEKR
jgi:hypothetical protein